MFGKLVRNLSAICFFGFFVFVAGNIQAEDNKSCESIKTFINSFKGNELCQSLKVVHLDTVAGKTDCSGLKEPTVVTSSDGKQIAGPSVFNTMKSELTDSCKEDKEICKDAKEEFQEYFDKTTGACSAIIGNFNNSSGQGESNIQQCADRVKNCLMDEEESSFNDEEYQANCSWVSIQKIDDMEELQDKISDQERELTKSMTEAQLSSTRASERKQKELQRANESLSKIQLEMGQTVSDLSALELKSESETAKLTNNLRSQLTQYRSNLSEAKAAQLIAIETTYINNVRAAEKECEKKAISKQESTKAKITSQNRKGLSMSAVNAYTKNSKEKSITYYKNTCMDSDSNYTNALAQAGEARLHAITQNKTKIANLEENIRNATQAYNDAVNLITKQNFIDKETMQQRQASLNLESMRLQQQMQELSNPAQSEIFSQMQEQQAKVKEFQALDKAKDRVTKLDKIGINKDSFEYLKPLAAASGATYDSKAIGFRNACCKEDSTDSLCSSVKEGDSGGAWRPGIK